MTSESANIWSYKAPSGICFRPVVPKKEARSLLEQFTKTKPGLYNNNPNSLSSVGEDKTRRKSIVINSQRFF